MKTAEQYLELLRKVKHKVFLFGEEIENVVDP